jgi:hypothetical protein
MSDRRDPQRRRAGRALREAGGACNWRPNQRCVAAPAAAADRGYAPAHAALGRFYDPNLHPRDVTRSAGRAALPCGSVATTPR